MNCTSNGIAGEPVDIIVGTDHTLRIELKSEDGTPFDLLGTTAITLAFPGTTGTVTLTLGAGLSIILPNALGAISAVLSAAFTSTLKVGRKLTFEVKVLKAGLIYKVQFKEMLNVIASST